MLKALLMIAAVYAVLNLVFGFPQVSIAVDGVPWHMPGAEILGAGISVLAGLAAGLLAIACVFAVIAGLIVLTVGLPVFIVCVVLCALLAPLVLPLVVLFGLGMLLLIGLGGLFA